MNLREIRIVSAPKGVPTSDILEDLQRATEVLDAIFMIYTWTFKLRKVGNVTVDFLFSVSLSVQRRTFD